MIANILNKKLSMLDKSQLEAIGLMGSYSRGDARKYSDIDIVCIVKDEKNKKDTEIEFIDGKYVVTNFVTIDDMEKSFTDASLVTKNILGLKQVKILYDPNDILFLLKQRAQNFQWTEKMQKNANEIAEKQLTGWIEEVYKALQGLISHDIGRMLNGLYGLTYGLFNVVIIQKGILLDGDNSFYRKVTEYFGLNSRFTKLSEIAFGIKDTKNLEERVIAGLLLFDEVTDQINDILTNKQDVIHVKKCIKKELMNLKPDFKLI